MIFITVWPNIFEGKNFKGFLSGLKMKILLSKNICGIAKLKISSQNFKGKITQPQNS